MGNNNIQEIQKDKEKKQSVEINRQKSMFDQNVAIHTNDMLKKTNTIGAFHTLEEENLVLRQEPLEQQMDYDLPKMTEQIENVEMLQKQETQQTEELKEEKTMVPLSIHEHKQEKDVQKQKVVYQQLQPGEALERYIQEVKNNKKTGTGKEELESAIQVAEKCRLQMGKLQVGQQLSLTQLQGQISDINEAILQIDRYIKKTKGFAKETRNGENQEEKRSLRESAKMLRIQLFLEKMDLYEKVEQENQRTEDKKEDKVDEHKLYQQQLDADARTQIYNEYKQNNVNEVEETAKSYIGKTKMEKKKSEQLILEDNRQIAKYSKKISESESSAKELQEKISNNGYDLRHKQFLKNEFYQQKVAQKVAQLRPLVIKEWMTDNFERIQENAIKIKEIFEQKGLEKRKVKGLSMKEVAKLLQIPLKDDENLDYVAIGYDDFYKKLSNLSPSSWPMFPQEIKDLVAAQIVLFEKRELLKKEYNTVTQSQETQSEQKHRTENNVAVSTQTKSNIPKPPQIKYNIPRAPQIKYNIPRAPQIKYNIPRAPQIKYNIPKAPILMNHIEKRLVAVNTLASQQNNQAEQEQMIEMLKKYLAQTKREKDNEELRKLLQRDKNQSANVDNQKHLMIGDGSEQSTELERITGLEKITELEKITGLETISGLTRKNGTRRNNLLGDESEVDYVEQFLKKKGLENVGVQLTEIDEESWLEEQRKNSDERALESAGKYRALYAQMDANHEVMEQQSEQEYSVMMQLLKNYVDSVELFEKDNDSESTALVSKQTLMNSVKEYILSVMGRNPALAEDIPLAVKLQSDSKNNFNQIWRVIDLKWKSARPAKAMYKLLGDGNNTVEIPQEMPQIMLTDAKEKELMQYPVETLIKEAQLSNERQTQMEQTEKEKEDLATKKKIEDLENQKINNEYGLQGMASQERELQKEQEKKKEEERRRQQEIEEHNQENDIIMPRLNQEEKLIVKSAIKDLAIQSTSETINIKKENNKLVLAFMERYKEMNELIDKYADEKDKAAYHTYIDSVREVFFKKYRENEKEYVKEQENFDNEKIGDIVREMTEFYGDRMMELQVLYEPLLSMQQTI